MLVEKEFMLKCQLKILTLQELYLLKLRTRSFWNILIETINEKEMERIET